jgi:lipopolysaccharide assembly protein A
MRASMTLPLSRSVNPKVGSTSQVSGAAMRYIQAVILLVFLAAIGVFALQNRDVITVNFLTWNLSEPVALLTVVAYLIGMLSGWTIVAVVKGSFRRITEHPRH